MAELTGSVCERWLWRSSSSRALLVIDRPVKAVFDQRPNARIVEFGPEGDRIVAFVGGKSIGLIDVSPGEFRPDRCVIRHFAAQWTSRIDCSAVSITASPTVSRPFYLPALDNPATPVRW
jgi:hypothetical protein